MGATQQAAGPHSCGPGEMGALAEITGRIWVGRLGSLASGRQHRTVTSRANEHPVTEGRTTAETEGLAPRVQCSIYHVPDTAFSALFILSCIHCPRSHSKKVPKLGLSPCLAFRLPCRGSPAPVLPCQPHSLLAGLWPETVGLPGTENGQMPGLAPHVTTFHPPAGLVLRAPSG